MARRLFFLPPLLWGGVALAARLLQPSLAPSEAPPFAQTFRDRVSQDAHALGSAAESLLAIQADVNRVQAEVEGLCVVSSGRPPDRGGRVEDQTLCTWRGAVSWGRVREGGLVGGREGGF